MCLESSQNYNLKTRNYFYNKSLWEKFGRVLTIPLYLFVWNKNVRKKLFVLVSSFFQVINNLFALVITVQTSLSEFIQDVGLSLKNPEDEVSQNMIIFKTGYLIHRFQHSSLFSLIVMLKWVVTQVLLKRFSSRETLQDLFSFSITVFQEQFIAK